MDRKGVLVNSRRFGYVFVYPNGDEVYNLTEGDLVGMGILLANGVIDFQIDSI